VCLFSREKAVHLNPSKLARNNRVVIVTTRSLYCCSKVTDNPEEHNSRRSGNVLKVTFGNSTSLDSIPSVFGSSLLQILFVLISPSSSSSSSFFLFFSLFSLYGRKKTLFLLKKQRRRRERGKQQTITTEVLPNSSIRNFFFNSSTLFI